MSRKKQHDRLDSDRLAAWLFKVALLAFPKRFRERYGVGMQTAFRERHDHSETVTTRHRIGSLALTLIDTAGCGLAERVASVRQAWRASRTQGANMRSWLDEIRVISRALAQSPGFTTQAILTIALGTVCLGAVYPILHQVVLRPLPYDQPDRLLTIRTSLDESLLGVTPPELMLLARQTDLFDGVAGVLPPQYDRSVIWTQDLPRERLHAIRATPDLMDVLGVAVFGPGYDAEPGAGEQVILSHGFWQNRFGGDSLVLGRTISLNDRPHSVVGVLPDDFEYPLSPQSYDVWVVYRLDPSMPAATDNRVFRPVARLHPAAGLERVSARVPDLLREFHEREATGIEVQSVLVRPLHEDLVGSVRLPLLLVAGAAMVVLLIAALNVGLLTSARNLGRQRELAVRRALGAGRFRIARFLLTEVALVATFGAVVGGAVSVIVTMGIVSASPLDIVRTENARMPWAAAPAFVGAAIVPLLVALIPAVRASRSVSLSGRGTTSSRRVRAAVNGVIAVETALVFSLLIAAALTLVSLESLTRVDPGFDPGGAVAVEVQLPPDQYEGIGPARFFQAAEERLQALLGVAHVGSVTHLPLDEENWGGSFAIQGRSDPPPDALPGVDWEFASPGYFAAAGIRIVEGRAFDATDIRDAPLVAIINETLARRYWPRGGAIGALVNGNGFDGTWFTVVGVAADVKQQGLEEASRGYMYMASLQSVFWTERQFVVRTATQDALALMPDIRQALFEMEPDITIGTVTTLEHVVHRAADPFRLRALLFGVFGLVAALLGMAGIHGVVSHGVQARKHEMGIRLAIGADAGGIFKHTLVEGLRPVIGGVVGGVMIVVFTAQWFGALVYGIEPVSPVVMVLVSSILAGTAVAAILPPALKARRLDPVQVLQNE